MSPRPADLPPSEFDEALKVARTGRSADALAAIQRLLEQTETTVGRAARAAAALANVAWRAEAAGDLETAERALDQAIRLKPDYADLHYRRACVLIARRRRPEARRALERSLEINSRFVAARVELSMLDAREGLIGEALESLRQLAGDAAIEDPRTFQQALSSLERADWDAAEAELRRALSLSDPGLRASIERFHERFQQGDIARAAEELRGLLPRHDHYPDLHYLIGTAELKLGHFDDALSSFARALVLNPDFHGARVLMAHALECLGQSGAAADQVALVLQADPAHREALDLRRRWSGRTLHPVQMRGPDAQERAA